MSKPYRCIVMGAAGRDFHVYLSFLRGNEAFRVVAFTATQIPFIDERNFPASLAGPGYDEDIPIYDESELTDLIREHGIDFVFFAYSDVPHADIMHKASHAPCDPFQKQMALTALEKCEAILLIKWGKTAAPRQIRRPLSACGFISS